jgi:cysteine desulfurase
VSQIERYSEIVTQENVTDSLVYLDHAATTPMRAESIAVMMPYLAKNFANPSGSHRFSRQARQVLDEARDVVAGVVGCKPGEVVFTGCGSESDNAAILGAVRRHGGRAVCSAAEHHAVLHCVEHLNGQIVPVDSSGVIDLVALEEVLKDTSGDAVSVVSVMAVNNEVGAITDMAAVSKLVRRRAPRTLLHTDAVQAACWLDLRTLWPLVDIMALSAHKFGGPKGVGILIVREGVALEPLVMGGGQERDRRSGTHNTAGIVAAAEALRLTDIERSGEVDRIGRLRDRLMTGLSTIDGLRRTIPTEVSVPGVVHVCFEAVESEALLYLLDEANVCASAASACASGAMEPSHVLSAMGIDPHWSQGALRLSLGHTTTEADVDRAIEVITVAVRRLREMSQRLRR